MTARGSLRGLERSDDYAGPGLRPEERGLLGQLLPPVDHLADSGGRGGREEQRGLRLAQPESVLRPNRVRRECEIVVSPIEQQAVQTQAMPLGNVTGMTQSERDLLGRWIAQGARIP